MKKFLMIFTVVVMTASIAFAQEGDKLSISTQIFLDKLNGTIQVDNESLKKAKDVGLKPVAGSFEAAQRESQFVADPVVKDGQTFMSAFVRLESTSAIGKLESLGVEIQETFLDGKLVTALIPVDKIEEVAAIADVSRVKAATMMRKSTNTVRQRTNVDDVLTFSTDAQSAGLPSSFDGSGVVLGVIDTGIDFNHIAFKDASGNSRIKQAYVYNGSSASTYSGSQITSTLTDDKSEDHGTHTSSTAGGSSVTVSGSTVTVTDNHANATYGGMAPGADLYLAGINGLSDTYLSNAINKIVTYADQQGKPVVVSNSWGSQLGPHDGTGDVADIYNSLFGDDHPNRVALFAASNDGGKSPASEAGGYHVKGTSSSASPLGSILRCHYYSDTDNGFYYNGIVTNAWFRSTVSNVTVKVLVLNSSTGAKVAETTVTPTTTGATVSGLSSYYSGSLYAYKDYVSANGKTQVMLYAQGFQSKSYTSSYQSNYTLAIQIYPTNGSATLDMWGGNSGYFTSHLSTNGYTWTTGTDDGCYSDEATIANVISIGAYATKNGGMITDYTIGDIADFSSWGTTSTSLTGEAYPWIAAPGARIIAGVNHNHTSSVDSYSYYGSTFSGDLVVNSSTNPYAYMEGTSMATPTAAGIVALWLQASQSDNAKSEYKNSLTVNKVKQIMAQTAIHDSYTDTGANASHFGNGKIDALAGIAEILDNNSPQITASPSSIDFGNVTAGGTATQTFTVTGANLEGNIALAKSGNNFAIDKTSITKNSDGTASATVTVTFSPAANVSQTYNGTVTLTSSNATTVTVSLTGKGVYNAPVIAANPTSLSFSGNSGSTYTKTVTVTGSNLQGNITAAIQNDANGFYSVSPASFNAASQTVTVTWTPTAGGTSTANLVLTTTGTGANTVTVPITGTAQGPTIAANPTSVTFSGYATQTYTQTVTVTGTNMSQNITASLTGANVYSIDKTSLAKTGGTITVTYTPTDAGNTNATLTLSSTGASTVTVPITGTAQAATPTLIVVPTSLTFSPDVNTPESKTFAVTGRFINEDVTITLNDPSGVFTLEQATIPAASISETDAVNVTVTFQSADEGDYTGSVTVASNGATSQTVNLSATISTGGAASDNYLNIAKYATIDEAGATVSGMSSIYKYTEYADDACAWLTISNYGANQADANQKWYNVNNLRGYSNSWSASDVFLGDDAYFGSNSSYSVYGSGYQIFYVTNCTQAKALVKGGSYSSSNATLSIYECTKNADGTLNASSTATTTQSGSNGVITSATLDASKIYKVQLSGGGSYPDLLEIGFQTPLNKPSLTASPTGIDFIAEPGETITETITVTGVRLTEDVTVTLTDDNGVYTLDKSSISIAEATGGATVTVTFNAPQQMGSYRGQATFTSGTATAKTVFYGAVGEKGTAYSNYLDIAQYSTIATGNWYDGVFANAYKWTEYEDDECAWLTVPAALPYFAWNFNDQNWCGVSSSASGGWYGHQWTATDVFQGYEYFQGTFEDETDTYAHMMGGDESNSTSNTTIFYGIYNVTNCTQVKAYAYNNGATSTYPAFIQIYELTENADGTLTQSDTRTDIQTSYTSGAVTMTSAELDASKIYFVAVGGYRGFTYEVAFRTPLTTTEATLATIESTGVVGQRYKISDGLVAIDYREVGENDVYLWCKDQGHSNNPTYCTDNQIDFMRDASSTLSVQATDWDQSNWVILKLTGQDGVGKAAQAKGKIITGGSIVGKYVNNSNYMIEVANNEFTIGEDSTYIKNVYCTSNFMLENLNLNGGEGAQTQGNPGVYYFFMNPKVQEICHITFARWDGDKFTVPSISGFPGEISSLNWDYNINDEGTPVSFDDLNLETDTIYEFDAVVSAASVSGAPMLKANGSGFTVAPLNLTGKGNIVTAINGVYADGYRGDIVGVEYVNTIGQRSSTPFKGVNIVVTRYSNGSTTSVKKIFK